MHSRKREKTFGPGRCIPLDGNAKARIMAYARAWTALHKEGRQHRGPITRAYEEVLEALLWAFHNSKTGLCFPSYEAIAKKARCCRDTVYEAIKVLEDAKVLTWVNRITHIRVRELDLFGKWQTRRQVIRTSNSYTFLDPKPGAEGRARCKSENPPRTLNQEIQYLTSDQGESVGSPDPLLPGIETAIARLGRAVKEKGAHEGSAAT